MRLILIRHGESTGSASNRGLTEQGLIQVQRLAERFRATGEVRDCQAFFSSPLQRALETAEVLAQAFPVSVIEQDPGFCEMGSGSPGELLWATSPVPRGLLDLPVTSRHLPDQEAER